jgi:hypothetical protein
MTFEPAGIEFVAGVEMRLINEAKSGPTQRLHYYSTLDYFKN